MAEFDKKLVAVLSKNIELGVAMNALAHMSIGLGNSTNDIHLIDYVDADNEKHPNISKMPFIILKANSNKIRTLRKQAIENNIEFTDFTNTMTVGTYKDQLERTKNTKEEDLDYYGIVLFGEYETVSELTKKFSLWK